MLHTSLHTCPPTGCPPATPVARALEARLQVALGTLAQLVVEDPKFIPVFELLEQELADIQTQNDTIERARKYLRTPL